MRILISFVIVGAVPAIGQQAEEGCENPCRLRVAEQYFNDLDAVYRSGSTSEDVAGLLSLTHEDVRYEHIAYGADFDREARRQTFHRNLVAPQQLDVGWCQI